ncbi:MAG: CPBP family intramembrane metalloprotease [Actinobacteria bacterium]|nr:CPBP family intramembrane metalloprotease [Actinomycetota bacterium]
MPELKNYHDKSPGKKAPVSNDAKIKWNSLDGLLSVVFLILILVGIYFGTSALLKYLGRENYIDLNITNIDSLTFSIFYSIQVLLMLGIVWFFAIYWRGSNLRDLGFRYYSLLKTIWYTFLALVCIFLFSFLYVLALKFLLGIEAPSSKIEELVANNNISSNILIIVTAVVAPFCEEIYFRGFLYPAFKKNFGVTLGIFLSSLLFALAHLELYSFLPILIIGWVLAYIYEKTKSIFTVIFLHSIYNLILISILLGRIEFIKMY